MKAVEETVARRIADSILETRRYPYSSDIIDRLMPLNAYHDLVYEYEVNNRIRDHVFPTADGIIQVLKIVLDGMPKPPEEAPAKDGALPEGTH